MFCLHHFFLHICWSGCYCVGFVQLIINQLLVYTCIVYVNNQPARVATMINTVGLSLHREITVVPWCTVFMSPSVQYNIICSIMEMTLTSADLIWADSTWWRKAVNADLLEAQLEIESTAQAVLGVDGCDRVQEGEEKKRSCGCPNVFQMMPASEVSSCFQSVSSCFQSVLSYFQSVLSCFQSVSSCFQSVSFHLLFSQCHLVSVCSFCSSFGLISFWNICSLLLLNLLVGVDTLHSQ